MIFLEYLLTPVTRSQTNNKYSLKRQITSELSNDECNLHDCLYLSVLKTIMTCDWRSDNNMVAQCQIISQLLIQPKRLHQLTSNKQKLNKNDSISFDNIPNGNNPTIPNEVHFSTCSSHTKFGNLIL